MRFEDLLQFIERDMRMSHVYQPVMLREILDRGGRASRKDIARALLNEDRSQLDYYLKSLGTWLVGCLQIGRS
jgi:ATP adenylyltransferase